MACGASLPQGTTTTVAPILLGVFIIGFGTIATGLNFIVTTHTMRAPGITTVSSSIVQRRVPEAGGVSEGTVRSQVRAIRQKLNVRSQLAAVAAYQQATEDTMPQPG